MKTLLYILQIITGLLSFVFFAAFWLTLRSWDIIDERFIIGFLISGIASIIFGKLGK
jgi:hypothetical protein